MGFVIYIFMLKDIDVIDTFSFFFFLVYFINQLYIKQTKIVFGKGKAYEILLFENSTPKQYI